MSSLLPRRRPIASIGSNLRAVQHPNAREAEVRFGQGQAIGTICRGFGILGAKLLSLAARVRRSEARPGQAPQGSGAREQPAQEAVSELTLDKLILKEALGGKY
jgi:hypothetical protein